MEHGPFSPKRSFVEEHGSSRRQRGQPPPEVVIQLDDEGPSSARMAKNGNDSPESGSLYSDEIPSGYNSGEQYDTISTGYMSGEAYELPETRMDLREPALDVIEECLQPLGAANSDEHIFMLPGSGPVGGVGNANNVVSNPGGHNVEGEDESSSSSSSEVNGDHVVGSVGADSITHASPINTYGKKLRKKVTTFAIPIEATPLKDDDEDEDENEAYESSDAGLGDAPTGGYRCVPSDTDTSAVDSDPNAILNDNDSVIPAKSKKRKRNKNMRNHDEAWFMSHDTKYWAASRVICFWAAIGSMVTATVVAAVLIATMPRNCDPPLDWYQGKVAMEVMPDEANGRLDVNALIGKLPRYQEMGIKIIHLKKLSNSSDDAKQFVNITETALGGQDSAGNLTAAMHKLNMSLIVQIPVANLQGRQQMTLEMQHDISMAVKFWMEKGADGIFLDGLEHYGADNWVAQSVTAWKNVIDRFGTSNYTKVLMTSYKFAHQLAVHDNPDGPEALGHISLLDASLDLDLADTANFSLVSDSLQEITAWDTIEGRPWINWNLQHSLPLSNAALAMQMLLPGTITVGQESLLQEHDLHNMTALRTVAVPVYMNGNYKRCQCETGTTKEVNYIMHTPIEDIVQLERFYSRRHRYVLVANFGQDEVTLEAVGRIYSGGVLVLDTSKSLPINTDVLFSEITLQSGEAIVIKLPK